ncbi:phage tail protein [Paenibacillus sp. HJL G12]|uniref:Phage tail protein n=1 Tax=Paenibacillus dendrobii TaxID=2691084 RepID=A0A7X3IDR3_9BACL|nr:tail fiber protein [Paenibacillus dendrobii]MWV42039.1 phage tail protein [Paenibacillus dendrobii]
MSEAYLGEIRMFAGNYAPIGWALCNGQLLNISDNEALYVLLGTTYGGDGRTTFGLPDLQGRIPVHPKTGYVRGAKAGTETVTLVSNQLPAHTHIPLATDPIGTETSPTNNVWASRSFSTYSDSTTTVNMNSAAISSVGGNQPHDNMMPSTTISFIISVQGYFPPQP